MVRRKRTPERVTTPVALLRPRKAAKIAKNRIQEGSAKKPGGCFHLKTLKSEIRIATSVLYIFDRAPCRKTGKDLSFLF